MPADRSFWHFVMEQQGTLSQLDGDVARREKEWKPVRSNCPELTDTIDDLILSVPGDWRARASNIFVGRVMDGESNASAWSHKQAGIVEINLQFTYAIDAYVTAFDEYVKAMRDLVNDVILDESQDQADVVVRQLDERFGLPWRHIDQSHKGWTDPRIIESWNVDLLKTGAPRRIQLDDAVEACEEFLIAHELGHHLLGHINDMPKKNEKADAVIHAILAESNIFDITRSLNRTQKQEVHADILAFLIVARGVDCSPSSTYLYRAILGSTLTLTTLAHLTGSWIEKDSSSTHPGSIERLAIVQCLTENLSINRGLGSLGDHPLDLLAQLRTFISIAFHDWLSKRWPEDFRSPGLLDAINAFLGNREDIVARVPIRTPQKENRSPDVSATS